MKKTLALLLSLVLLLALSACDSSSQNYQTSTKTVELTDKNFLQYMATNAEVLSFVTDLNGTRSAHGQVEFTFKTRFAGTVSDLKFDIEWDVEGELDTEYISGVWDYTSKVDLPGKSDVTNGASFSIKSEYTTTDFSGMYSPLWDIPVYVDYDITNVSGTITITE